MIVKLLTEHHLEFLSLKGSCTGSSESTLVKMPHCWKSHVAAQINSGCITFMSFYSDGFSKAYTVKSILQAGASIRIITIHRDGGVPLLNRVHHRNSKTQFHDLSMISNVISMTI